MRAGLLGGVCAAGVPAAAGAHRFAAGSVVRGWNDLALQTVRETSASDAVAARLYAMVNAAIYDAVNGTAGTGEPRQAAVVEADHPRAADSQAAAAVAGHDVLATLYPGRAATYDARLAADLAGTPPGLREDSQDWGHEVAVGVLVARTGDGSGDPEPCSPGAPSRASSRGRGAASSFRTSSRS
jgi:hypothetical protein